MMLFPVNIAAKINKEPPHVPFVALGLHALETLGSCTRTTIMQKKLKFYDNYEGKTMLAETNGKKGGGGNCKNEQKLKMYENSYLCFMCSLLYSHVTLLALETTEGSGSNL